MRGLNSNAVAGLFAILIGAIAVVIFRQLAITDAIAGGSNSLGYTIAEVLFTIVLIGAVAEYLHHTRK